MKTIIVEFTDVKDSIKIKAKDLKSAIELLVKQRIDLSEANLKGAILYGADLGGANLKGADLKGADLREADLYGAYLEDADLSGADLSNANLTGADLKGADLRRAYLKYANLSDVDLFGANLSFANLSGAGLKYANLSGADLSKADLYGVNLYGAYLSYANLSGAYLSEANLSGANLIGTNLKGAYLFETDLTDVKGLDYQICPENGSFEAYKATTKGVIKIEIPEDAKRTSCISSRKCRASKIKVLDGNGCGGSSPTYTDKPLIYNQGDIIESDSFDSDPREECTHGIHFFMSKQEAINWFNWFKRV